MVVERTVDGKLRWCVVHSGPQKPGSPTDKPPGSIIKCWPHTSEGKAKALAMHRAILASQAARKNEPTAVLKVLAPAGGMLINGDATHYLYPQKYKRHIGEPIFIGEGDRVLGTAMLGEPSPLKPEQLVATAEQHGLDVVEVQKRWDNVKQFWLYPVTVLEKYTRPAEYTSTEQGISWIENPVIRKKASEMPKIAEDLLGFEFTEGSEGTGVIQTHEIGKAEQFADGEACGWAPIELAPDQLDELAGLISLDVAEVTKAYVSAQEGDARQLTEMIAAVDKQELGEVERELLGVVSPINIHTDIRMVEKGQDYWQGGEAATPGNQFALNTLAKISEGEVAVEINTTPPEGDNPIRGPVEWMEIGVSKAQTFPPGAPGSTSSEASRFRAREQFEWEAGIQEPDSKEFRFTGDTLNGRYVLKRLETGSWAFTRPEDQGYTSAALRDGEEAVVWDARIIKRSISDEQRTVTAIVLKPGVTDAQGDKITDHRVIEAAAENYLMKLILGKAKIGYMHNDFTRALIVVQSWVASQPLFINGKNVPAGAWILKVKVFDDEVWAKVKSGEIRGFSIGGKARVLRLAA